MGDQNGRRARSVPGSTCAAGVLSARTHSMGWPSLSATNAMLRPSGDTAKDHRSDIHGVVISTTRSSGTTADGRRYKPISEAANASDRTAIAMPGARRRRRFDTAARAEAVPSGSLAASSISMRASAMWWKRRPGSFSRQRRTARRTPAGTVGGKRFQSGARSRMAASVSAVVAAPNAARPVNISYNTQPKAQTSLRLSRLWPRACSGLMYAGVPAITPSRVGALVTVGAVPAASGSGAIAFARPKSSTFTVPATVSLMLAGLRSRWMIPLP